MKWMRLHIPDRLHQEYKKWAVLSGHQLSDAIYYLFDNIPAPVKTKPNSRLLAWLDNPSNKKKLNPDQQRIYELIALGLVKPTVEESRMISKWIDD